jgi:arylsulfatase A-like enzyme
MIWDGMMSAIMAVRLARRILTDWRKTGAELTRFYVNSVCSPTRASLMTGQSAIRLGHHSAHAENHA